MHSFALVFPGQGAQSLGMLAALNERYPVVAQTFDEASAILGFDLWALTQNGPEEGLNQTVNTQPVLLTASVAIWRIWQAHHGAEPTLLAGHSLGEYSALVCAGALEFTAAIQLVVKRAQLMQAAVPVGHGAMAAVLGLDAEQIQAVCAAAANGDVLEAANFNAPGQIVVAGHHTALTRFIPLAKAAGAKRIIPLPVSVPSHCTLMNAAAEQFHIHLTQTIFQAPRWPILHNATVTSCLEPDAIRTLLAQQLYRPVRWVETIQAMVTVGVHKVIEMGPGQVLTGLIKRIDKSVHTFSTHDPHSLEQALQETSR